MSFPLKHVPLAMLGMALVFTSCKKDDKKTDDTSWSTQLDQHNDDANRVSNEMDAVADDGNLVVETNAGLSGKEMSPQSIICDATVTVDTVSNPKKVTVVYNGTNCLGNRTRTGTVVFSMPAGVHWRDQNATLTVTYQNLKITRLSDNKSITINGTHTITNVTGGLLQNLPTLGTITHRINSSNMSITFDDNSQRTWSVARQRSFSYNNGIVVSITGTQTVNGVANVAEWGTNRFGSAFTTAITSPIIIRQDCNLRVTSGTIQHTGLAATTTVQFGLDAQGNPTSCPGTGNYYLKLSWTGPNGNTATLIHVY